MLKDQYHEEESCSSCRENALSPAHHNAIKAQLKDSNYLVSLDSDRKCALSDGKIDSSQQSVEPFISLDGREEGFQSQRVENLLGNLIPQERE